jgi:hypothetical protein
VRVEKDDSIARGETWKVSEMVDGIEAQAKPSSFGHLQLFNRVANIADTFKIAVRKDSVIKNQQARSLKWCEGIRR